MHIRYLLIVAAMLMQFAGPSSVAQVSQLTIAAEGMSCPFCTYGVEKKLKEVDGVELVTVDLQSGNAIMQARRGESIPVADVPEAVKAAGFTPGKLEAVATGTLVSDEDQKIFLKSPKGDRLFLLFGAKDELNKQIDAWAGSEKNVRVSGVVHLHADAVPTLTPVTVEELAQ